MQQCLSRSEFERWERLMLQRTLDSMNDIIYCPKCANPIIVEENNSHSFCLTCNIDYCKSCKEIWHSVGNLSPLWLFCLHLREFIFHFIKKGKCLTGEEKIENKVKLYNLSANQLLKLTEQEIRERFGGGEAKLVLNLQQKAVEASDLDAVKLKYKFCPKCRAPTERISGQVFQISKE